MNLHFPPIQLPNKATLVSECAPAAAPSRLSADNSSLDSSFPLWRCSAAFPQTNTGSTHPSSALLHGPHEQPYTIDVHSDKINNHYPHYHYYTIILHAPHSRAVASLMCAKLHL